MDAPNNTLLTPVTIPSGIGRFTLKFSIQDFQYLLNTPNLIDLASHFKVVSTGDETEGSTVNVTTTVYNAAYDRPVYTPFSFNVLIAALGTSGVVPVNTKRRRGPTFTLNISLDRKSAGDVIGTANVTVDAPAIGLTRATIAGGNGTGVFSLQWSGLQLSLVQLVRFSNTTATWVRCVNILVEDDAEGRRELRAGVNRTAYHNGLRQNLVCITTPGEILAICKADSEALVCFSTHLFVVTIARPTRQRKKLCMRTYSD